MALEDVFECAPIISPQTCTEYTHNWSKLKELFDVINCLLGQVLTVANMLSETYNLEVGDNSIVLPESWDTTESPLSGDFAQYFVIWNGQVRHPNGDSEGEYGFTIDTNTRTINFTDAFGEDCQVTVVYMQKSLLDFTLINCEETTEPCV